MKKKVTVAKKTKNTDVRNYDLCKNSQENEKDNKASKKRIWHYLEESEIEVFQVNLSDLEIDVSAINVDLLRILDVEIDVPELVVTALDIKICEIEIDFPEIEYQKWI